MSLDSLCFTHAQYFSSQANTLCPKQSKACKKKSNGKNSKNNNKTEEKESKLSESFFPKLASKTAPDNDNSDETDSKEKKREQLHSSIDAILKKKPDATQAEEKSSSENKDSPQREGKKNKNKIRFKDDIEEELKGASSPENFSETRLKSMSEERRRSIIPEDEKGSDLEAPIISFDDKANARGRSTTFKRGLYLERELPDIPSKDIVIEKGGPSFRQNLMGQKGFVSDLLETVVSKEREGSLANVSVSKPMSRQSVVERRSAIALIGSEINQLFDKKNQKSLRKISSKKSVRRRSSSIIAHAEESTVTKSDTLPTELSHLRSGWQPKDSLESFSKATFRPRRQSWVGAYVDGYDYWTKKPAVTEPEEIHFEIDKRSQTWYDLPVAEEVQIEIPMDETSEFVQNKTKMEKLKAPEELAEIADERNEYTVSPRTESNVSLQEKRKMFSFDQREPLPEKISNDLYQMFRDFCKSDDLSAVQNRLSLLNADRCLEKVGLLDHKVLTSIHTGFCFKAAGGSRYRGLTFAGFKLFIEMVAETKNMPIFDFVNRLKLAYVGIVVLSDES
ncbi:uncharacterized protein CDAR_447821 [Caerostris darwini]|uniref:Uncharacterized protein n=1 Tax=Caerostris darwini TaxID=1538125 RepID=A0AAV4PPI5_9ARAC|nr:uncharacterized protein CDAR_447821 [Caerostris darwini]